MCPFTNRLPAVFNVYLIELREDSMKGLFLTGVLLAVRAGAAEPMTLAQSESTALSHHPTIHLAEEETRVANLKKAEAYRGIWPSVATIGAPRGGWDTILLISYPNPTTANQVWKS